MGGAPTQSKLFGNFFDTATHTNMVRIWLVLLQLQDFKTMFGPLVVKKRVEVTPPGWSPPRYLPGIYIFFIYKSMTSN